MKKRGRKVVALSCACALGIAALLAALGRRELAAWLDPPEDPERAVVRLSLKWDAKDGVRCFAVRYLRPDGTWLDAKEMSTDPAPGSTAVRPDLGELETYLAFRKRDRAPWFGESRPLTVLVFHDREVPWRVVRDMIELCNRLGIDVDTDSDD